MCLRQVVVFYSGTILLLIFWAITPLQSGVFSTQTSLREHTVHVKSTSVLAPLQEQTANLSANFMNTAYSVFWLGQDLPSFTNSSFAVAPFETTQIPSILTNNASIMARTRLYGSNLSCSPAKSIQQNSEGYVSFDDGQGCAANNVLKSAEGSFTNVSFAGYFIGYYNDSLADVDYNSLSQAGCSSNSTNKFLAIWKKLGYGFNDSTASTVMFCEPSYYFQDVNATVRVADSRIMHVTPLGTENTLRADDFNITQFEYIIGTGIVPGRQQQLNSFQDFINGRRDIADESLINQSAQLLGAGLIGTSSPMASSTLAAMHSSAEQLLDPRALEISLRAAYQLTFAVAVQEVLTKTSSPEYPVATLAQPSQAIVLVKPFTIAACVVLSLVAILTLCMMLNNAKRRLRLKSDPSTIAHLMYTLYVPNPLLEQMRHHKTLKTNQLKNMLLERKFRMINSRLVECTDDVDRKDIVHDSSVDTRPDKLDEIPLALQNMPSWPFELRRVTGACFVSIMIAILALLVLLGRKAQKKGNF